MESLYQIIKGWGYDVLNRIIPKKRNRILLHTGLGYRDNIKAIGDYLARNGYLNRYEIYCDLPNNKDVSLIPEGFKVVTTKIESYFVFFRSKYVFYCFGQMGAKPRRQNIINMWHGTPLKNINNLGQEKKRDYFYFSYVLATSEMYKPIFAEAYACPIGNVAICGHTRNDILFENHPYPECVGNQRYILWTPTFRKSDILGVYNGSQESIIPIFSNSDLIDLNDYLLKNDMHMIIKLHPMETFDAKQNQNFSNLHLFSHDKFVKEGNELYAVASNAKALITDYSSMAFDFMLLDRPIGYTLDDVEMYSVDRGFIFEKPEDFMPGEKIYNKEDFYKFIMVVATGMDRYKEDRHRVNDLVNYYKDGNNCRRVLELAGIQDV